ncbi:MAG: NAD(P)H-dependent oxidoreductase subunit E [Dehalococcoidia bacterium]|nr:MAG: NAD(P)H-dependent oxidoreductase subunit E [Dehalococcoidia bacterium]
MRKVIATASKVDEIIDRHNKDDSHLIQILLEIQREYNWLPKEALLWLGERLGVSINQIYQIATFYKAFSLVPRGRHLVRVCTGTACHVRGAIRLLDRTTQVLGIEPGENSRDMRFSLETVNCLGCCAIGPALVIDEETLGNPSAAELEEALSSRG